MPAKKIKSKKKFTKKEKKAMRKKVLGALEKSGNGSVLSSLKEVKGIVQDVKTQKGKIKKAGFSKKKRLLSKKKKESSKDDHSKKMVEHVKSKKNPKLVFKSRKIRKAKVKGDTMTIHSTSGRQLIVYKILIILFCIILLAFLTLLL